MLVHVVLSLPQPVTAQTNGLGTPATEGRGASATGTPTTEGHTSVTGGFHRTQVLARCCAVLTSPVLVPPQRASALSAQPSNLGGEEMAASNEAPVGPRATPSLLASPGQPAMLRLAVSSGPSRLWRGGRAGRRPPERRSHSGHRSRSRCDWTCHR
eukprot:scaffold100613_cov63-Phaeocystis_antarctica.AAC.6